MAVHFGKSTSPAPSIIRPYENLLIDVDGLIPNLGLMQLSTYLKSMGQHTTLLKGIPHNKPSEHFDAIWASCIFSENAKRTSSDIPTMFPDSDIHLGGMGINFDKTPEGAWKVRPDYWLYPDIRMSMGYTTRGCIRKCPFCIVHSKDGLHRRWQHPKEFHDPRFNIIHLMDDNWLADEEWFMETSEWIISNGLNVEEEGIDLRLVNPKIAHQLKRIRFDTTIKSAWDFMENEYQIIRGLNYLKEVKFPIRSKMLIYVLVGFNSTPEQDKYRCRKLKEMRVTPFVMQYGERTEWTKKIARWCNRPQLFWSIDIDDYEYGGENRR